MGKVKYDCLKCPGYCCSYPNIHVKPKDIQRLAEHFKVSEEEATKRFTKRGFKEDGMKKPPRVLRHQKDEHFSTINVRVGTAVTRTLEAVVFHFSHGRAFSPDQFLCVISEGGPSAKRIRPVKHRIMKITG